MKIVKLFFIFLCTISIASCGSDDDNDTPDPMNEESSGNMEEGFSSIVSIWEVIAIEASGTSTAEIAGQTIVTDFVGEGIDLNYSTTFTEEPNEITAEGDYNIELTTTIVGQSITETIPGILFIDSGDWSIDNDQLTITTNGIENTGTITTLTETSLVIEINLETVIEQQGIENMATINAVVRLQRQ